MEQVELLRLAVDVLEQLQIPYGLVGSFASGIWGEARFTADIDIVVDVRLGQVSDLCAAFPAPQFYVSKEAAREAVLSATQFNVIHPGSGNKIDFMISRDDVWSRNQLVRRRRIALQDGREGFAVSPEDVIISKMRYYQEGGSEKHLRDITGILAVQAEKVDREYIAEWAKRLQVDEVWDAIVSRMERLTEPPRA